MHIIPLEAHATCPCEWLPGNPQAADDYLRQELALVLAKKLISEDLVQIQTNYDMYNHIIVHAKIKIIQGE